MNLERIQLLRDIERLEKEKESALSVFCTRVANARQRMIDRKIKRLEEIKKQELIYEYRTN